MSAFLMNGASSMSLASFSSYSTGSYSISTLDPHCKMSLAGGAAIGDSHSLDGRSELYCNSTFSLDSTSYILSKAQGLIYVNAPTSVGATIVLKIDHGATLIVNQSLQIADHVYLTLMNNSNFEIASSASGIVVIASSKGTSYTRVKLFPSAKIINQGSMSIGNGQSTTVQLYDSGLLQVTPLGTFTIASSVFDIGPSSFWIIDGDFSFDEGSSLSSGLQSNITISAKRGKGYGIFKTVSGGNCSVMAGATMSITGAAQISGSLTLQSSSQAVIDGQLALGSSATLNVGSFSGIVIDNVPKYSLIQYSRIQETVPCYLSDRPRSDSAPDQSDNRRPFSHPLPGSKPM